MSLYCTVLFVILTSLMWSCESCQYYGNLEHTYSSDSTTSRRIKGSSMFPMPCLSDQRCTKFDDVFNVSIPLFATCASFLRGSCIFLNAQQTDFLSAKFERKMKIISRGIADRCNCRNRSIELFCRYLLPKCSFPGTNQTCSVTTCDDASITIEQSCSGYCRNLFNNCISDQVMDQLNKVFANFGENGKTICESSRNSSCWEDTNDKFVGEETADDFCASVTTITVANATTDEPAKVYCPQKEILSNNQSFTFERTEVYRVVASEEICEATGLPLAAASCMPISGSKFEPSSEGRFDPSTLELLPCGVTISNLLNSTNGVLAQMFVLTSRPETLTEEDISNAANILALFLNMSQNEEFDERNLTLATTTVSNLFAGQAINIQNRGNENQRSVETKQTLLQTLNGFAGQTALPTNMTKIEVVTQNVTVQIQRLPEEIISNEIGIAFNLTDIRANTQVVAEIPLEAIEFARHSFESERSQDTDNVDDFNPVFYATLLGREIPLNASETISQVISIGVRNASMANISVTISYEDVQIPVKEIELEDNPVMVRLPPEVNRILYVRNLPYKITAEEMYDIFGKYGAIRQIRIGTTSDTKGTAYVVYEDIFDAKNACDHLSGFNVCNRYLVVLYYNPNRQFKKRDAEKKQEQLQEMKAKYGVSTDPKK